MATVRELVAKLGFDVDTSGADQFQRRIDGLKKGLNTLFTAKVLQGATALEDSFLESQRKIKYLAGPAGLEALNEALLNVSETASKVDVAESIRQGLEVTTDPQFVAKMAEFGGLLADAFGGTMQDRTQELIQGAFSGDFGGLVSAGLFTQQEAEFLKGANINTVQGKLTIISRLEAKRADLLRAQVEALKASDVQTRRLGRNIENIGKIMGSVISPVWAAFLDIVNDILEALTSSAVGQALAKFVAIGGAIQLVAKPLQFIGFVLSKIGFSMGGLLGVAGRLAGVFGLIATAANSFFELLTGKDILEPFRVILQAIPEVIAAFEKMGSFFAGKIGERFTGFLDTIGGLDIGGLFGGETPAPALAMANGVASSTVDNRKAEINVNVNGGDPEQVKAATISALNESGFSQSLSRAKQEIAARNTQRIGANQQ